MPRKKEPVLGIPTLTNCNARQAFEYIAFGWKPTTRAGEIILHRPTARDQITDKTYHEIIHLASGHLANAILCGAIRAETDPLFNDESRNVAEQSTKELVLFAADDRPNIYKSFKAGKDAGPDMSICVYDLMSTFAVPLCATHPEWQKYIYLSPYMKIMFEVISQAGISMINQPKAEYLKRLVLEIADKRGVECSALLAAKIVTAMREPESQSGHKRRKQPLKKA